MHLILLAGGRGSRAAEPGSVPKQFRPTGGGLLFAVSLREFLTLDAGSGFRPADLVITVPDEWRRTVDQALQGLDIPWSTASSGATRTASAGNAVQELAARFAPAADDLVAVHDTARPFASADLLLRLGRAAAESGAAVPGIPVSDTIVQSHAGQAAYLERSSLVAVQTPQVFRWDLFHQAHVWAAAAGADFTDDGGLLAARGHVPTVVTGEQDNWKVTTGADWRRAEALLESN